MMQKWKDMSRTEKFLAGFIIALIIAIALNWTRVYEGIKKGMQPYQKEQKQK